MQKFKSSKVKKFLNEANKAPEVNVSTALEVIFQNIVPHASKYFQSCLPLLSFFRASVNVRVNTVTPDTRVSASYLLPLFSGGSCFTAVFFVAFFRCRGGNSLLDAQTRKRAAENLLI